MKRTLEVGPGTPEDGIARPRDIWADCGEVETLDGAAGNSPTYVHDLRQLVGDGLRDRFDYVLASHVLEHIPRGRVSMAMGNLVKVCRVGGEICVIVPSLEWAAGRIVAGDNSMGVQGMLYGGQREDNEWDVHYAGYTLAALGVLARTFGLEVRAEGQAPFEITGSGKRYEAMSNYILAVKRRE